MNDYQDMDFVFERANHPPQCEGGLKIVVLTQPSFLLLSAQHTTHPENTQEHSAALLPETCEYNTYMCCWTGHDGGVEMYGNADVCRVLDYPQEGEVLEMPRDDEGPVYW